jgi:hypothetical protein
MDSLALGELQARTFQGLLGATDPVSGLIADRWPSPSACSIGAQGFAFTVWAIAAARGWMSRGEAAGLTLKGLRTLYQAPQGASAAGVSGHRGWFYHFLNRQTGLRAGGILAAYAMGLGTALVTVGVAAMAVWAREGTFASLPSGAIARAAPLLEITVGAVVSLVAFRLFLAAI